MELTQIKGIGEKRKRSLLKLGITNPKELAKQKPNDTILTKQMTKTKANKLINESRKHIIEENLKNTHLNDKIILKLQKNIPENLIKKSIHSFLEIPNHLKNKISIQIKQNPQEHQAELEFLGHREKQWNKIKQKLERYKKGIIKPKTTLSTQKAKEELKEIKEMDKKFQKHIKNLDKENTVDRTRNLSIQKLEKNFKKQFGEQIYLDPLLSIIQQYSITDVPILNPNNNQTGINTGFNLSFFGDAGTGKTFSSVDIILGNENLPAFGIPGRNRYCSGMTPAAFVRKGEAYQGRKFNFLIPEFREWFTHSDSMTEFLKLALERKKVRYETYREEISPYKFNSFFNVNYNVDVSNQSWKTISNDPHFRALRDRLLTRLHVMNKNRYQQIAKSQTNLLLEKKQIMELANKIRDHISLIYATHTNEIEIEMEENKSGIILTDDVQDRLEKFREKILAGEIVASPRIEKRMIQVAASATLLEYWNTYKDPLPISNEAWEFAEKVLSEELETRRNEA